MMGRVTDEAVRSVVGTAQLGMRGFGVVGFVGSPQGDGRDGCEHLNGELARHGR